MSDTLPFYIIGRSPSKLNKHYEKCKEANQAYIKCHKINRKKLYSVQLDMFSTDSRITELGLDLIKRIRQREEDHLESQRPMRLSPKGYFEYSMGSDLLHFKPVSEENLESVCKSIFDVSQKYRISIVNSM